MRAKDFIEYNRDNLRFTTVIKETLDRFADYRNNLSKTNRHYKQHLENADKWAYFIEKCTKLKVTPQKHWDFMQELKRSIATDDSFAYLFQCLSKEEVLTPDIKNAEAINAVIVNQYEDYPKSFIDDYLINPTNKAFSENIENRNYSEEQELEIFNSAYRLFDELRQQLQKPKHAAHLFKEHRGSSEQITDDTLRLLSIFVHDYNYDFSTEQRDKLNQIADSLGKYIQNQANKKFEKLNANERWSGLLTTVDNMVSCPQKIEMLLTEKTRFLQLSQAEQQFDPDFANKCQLEIDRIKQIQELLATIESNETSNSKIPRCQKATTDTLIIILKKADIIQSADNTKIANLISYLTGYASEPIRKRLSNPDELTSNHKNEVEYINKILKALNIDETINYNKHR